jgi:O-antigen ligase
LDLESPPPFVGIERALPYLAVVLGMCSFLSITGTTIASVLGGLIFLRRALRIGWRNCCSLPGMGLPLLVYAVSFLLSAYLGQDPALSFKHSRELRRILLPYLVANCLSSRSDVQRLVRLSVCAAMASSIYTFFQYCCGGTYTTLGDTHTYKPFEFVRPCGLSSTCNDCGQLLMLALALVLGPLCFFAYNRKEYMRDATCAVVVFLGMMRTLCRSAQIGAAAGLVITGVVFRPKRLVAAGLVLVCLSPLVPESLRRRSHLGDYDLALSPNRFRIRMLEVSWEMSKKYLPWGIGRRNFQQVLARLHPEDEQSPHSHNNYTNLLVEQGVLGLVSFVWFQFRLFAYLYRELRRRLKGRLASDSDYLDRVLMGATYGLVAFAVTGLFHFNWGDALPVTFMWVLIGLVYAVGEGYIRDARVEKAS